MAVTRVVRWIGWVLGVMLVLAAGAVGAGWWLLRASLPTLDGELERMEIVAPVEIARDDLGVPTVRGTSRRDLAFALGFVHAQDRMFQMDLLRRRPAGELAELFGTAAVEWDVRIRRWRLARVARQALTAACPVERELLEAYADGVNAGVAELGERPFEYLVLGVWPRPWAPEDTLLVVLSMFLELTPWTGERELAWGAMSDLLPPALFDALATPGTEWDAPIVPGAFAVPPLPGPEVLDLRHAGHGPGVAGAGAADEAGSNSWVVAGTETSDGRAILAGDMHLGLTVPNIWYRAALEWFSDDDDRRRRLVGVTLPGAPWLVAGSNGDVAWAFTNSYVDVVDAVVLEVADDDPERYRTPDGWRRLQSMSHRVDVRGAAPRTVESVWSEWGPVVAEDHRGRPVAVRWSALVPGGLNLALGGLETAATLEQALDRGPQCGIPPQNLVVATADGRLGWTIAGRLPRRTGFDGRRPASWAHAVHRWDGWFTPAEVPRVVDPVPQRIWTANARVVGSDGLDVLGDGGYPLGARALQIRSDLALLVQATESDLLSVQLDDRAMFLERWRLLLLQVLTDELVVADPARAELRRVVQRWSGRAAIDDPGYRLVRAFRLETRTRALDPLTAACGDVEPCGWSWFPQHEGVLWKLVSERPPHLLLPDYQTWSDLLLEAADGVIAHFTAGGGRLADATWGRRNRLDMAHPLAGSLPVAGRWLRMPRDPLPGDAFMPRVQTPSFGASQRMVVSPGREDEGIFHMPGGQSGHPMSPFFDAGHAAWAEGEPSPFLPGERRHLLRLLPAAAASD
jgi:penicillin amidase